MRACAAAAQADALHLVLQAGPSARAHTSLPVPGAMIRHLAEAASVPVVLHLDHGTGEDDCRAALDAGFISVMVDGSRLPVAENVALTARIADLARAAGTSR